MNDFIKEISEIPGGESIRLCIQCGTCTASCPNAEKMQHTPAQLIAMARAGLRQEVLSSNAMWLCLSCYTCTVRCPRGIKQTELMHILESLAVRHRLSSLRSRTPALYRSFSDFIYSTGSVPETGFMTWFYIMTNPTRSLKMLPVALNLLWHDRMSIRLRKLKPEGKRQLRAILERAQLSGGI